QSSPVAIPGLSGVAQLVTGYNCTYAVMTDGTVKAWGVNSSGELGIGNTTNQSSPVAIPGLSGVEQLVKEGYGCAYAVMTDGTIKAWGVNSSGELGIGNTTNQSSPVAIPGLSGVDQLVTGYNCAYAVMTDGTVKAWGYNDSGQLGIGNTTNQSSPVAIPGLSGVEQLVTYVDCAYAVMTDGTVKAWGNNAFGKLGIGNSTNQSLPVAIPGLSGVEQLVTDVCCAYAIMTDGTFKAWGKNDYGQLGIGNTTHQFSPVAIPGLSGVEQLVTGEYCAYAVMSDGTVKAWGYNYYGKLGIGNTTDQSSPVTIPGLSGAEQLVTGYNCTYAVISDGTVKAWGDNGLGKLGWGYAPIFSRPITWSYMEATAQTSWGVSNTVTFDKKTMVVPFTIQKWALGVHSAEYFDSNGTEFTGSFEALENGLYTLYEKDGNGCEYIQTVMVDRVFTPDPIDSFTEAFTDISVASTGIDVNIGRVYDSSNTAVGVMGKGWTFSYCGKIENVTYTYTDDNSNTQTAIVEGLKKVTMPGGVSYMFRLEDGVYTAYNTRATMVQNSDGTFTITDTDDTAFNFNINGYFTSVVDKNGNTQTVSVDVNGNVQSITDTVGRIYSLGYTGGKITSVTDPIGRTVTYGYTGDYLTTVTDPMGYTTTYTYSDGLLKETINPVSNVEKEITYDLYGKLFCIKDSSGEIYTYILDGDTYTVSDSENNETVYIYENGVIQSVTDSGGNYTAYNQYGETVASDDISYQYDESGNPVLVTYENDSTDTFTYDANGNLQTFTDRNGIKTFYQDYVGGNPTLIARQKDGTTIDYSPICDQSLFKITHYTYNANGTVYTHTDVDGMVTTYTYDANGNMLTATSVKDSVTISTATNTYNNIGWKLTESATVGGKTTSAEYKYDLNRTTLRTKNQDNEYTRYVYDAVGRLVHKIGPDDYSAVADGLNNTPADYTYSDNTVGERYIYNTPGDTLRFTNEQDEVTRSVYDAERRLVQKVEDDQYNPAYDGLNNVTPVDTYSDDTVGYRYIYNSNDDVIRGTGPTGDTTRYIYDINKRLIQRIEPEQYNPAYDGLNEATPVDTYSDDTVGYRYTYDENDNMLKETDPDDNITRYVHDQNGNLI
ncbi:MAG: DUF6531 domain-containing protein, partial [Oscillospiraceae bacterium]|nr:DUF6531 domain-containing protein [Oscillospiraceae bacterium]